LRDRGCGSKNTYPPLRRVVRDSRIIVNEGDDGSGVNFGGFWNTGWILTRVGGPFESATDDHNSWGGGDCLVVGLESKCELCDGCH
jgi:hypothetical protein